MDAALRADDDFRGVPVAVSRNAALVAVLDQFTPVLRRAERLRFASLGGRASLARHDELIRLCAALDAESAAAVAFDTWLSLPAIDEPASPSRPTTAGARGEAVATRIAPVPAAGIRGDSSGGTGGI